MNYSTLINKSHRDVTGIQWKKNESAVLWLGGKRELMWSLQATISNCLYFNYSVPKQCIHTLTADRWIDFFLLSKLNPLELTMAVKLSVEQRKFILKQSWKCKNVVDVQGQFRKKFQTDPPIQFTITQIRDKFEANGTV